jgi:ABC-2 type transport system permease protein
VTEKRPRAAIVELTLARFRMFFREPSAVFWTFGFPVILSIALGAAFRNRPPEAVRVAIEAGPGADVVLAELTREDAAAQGAPGEVKAKIEDPETAHRDLRVGKVLLLVSPAHGDSPRTYRYDDTRPQARLARAIVDDRLQRAEGRVDPTRANDERVTELGTRYVDFLIPGLIGMNLMSSSMWGIGYLIVDMRTRKLITRMLATPMRRGDFLLSFVLMRSLFVLLEVPVLLAFGWIAFGVKVTGSPVVVLTLSVLGALTFAGLGLLVASRARNTQTVGGLMNLVMMPMFIGSGVFFAASNFPDAVQPLLRALPLTVLNDALRAVVNEGASFAAVTRPMAVLAAWALISFAAALKLFRWT